MSSGSNNEEEEKASAGFSKVRAAELLDVRTREVYLGLVETSLVSNYISMWGRGWGEGGHSRCLHLVLKARITVNGLVYKPGPTGIFLKATS